MPGATAGSWAGGLTGASAAAGSAVGAGKTSETVFAVELRGMSRPGKPMPAQTSKTASKAPVKNVDLWQALDEAQARHRIDWRWIKGHAGHDGNERADALANRGVELVLSGKVQTTL